MSTSTSEPVPPQLVVMMRALFSERADARLLWEPPSEPRGIVTDHDATDAILYVAAAFDAYLCKVRPITEGRARDALELLAVVYEYVRPLPQPRSPSSDDPIGDELRRVVKALRDDAGP
jgi:hypothetical protein